MPGTRRAGKRIRVSPTGPNTHAATILQSGQDKYSRAESEVYDDPSELLKPDLRQDWWAKYGELTGKGYKGLPEELNRDDLAEITALPLLNYLVALSFAREKLDFSKDINLNTIYDDLLAAVHEWGYEKRRAYGPIRHMKLEEFGRVLEEVGLAAWHGDGRTVREIEDHCQASGLSALLKAFREGAEVGVTSLLAAFFFRQYGLRASGDPTFVFTHNISPLAGLFGPSSRDGTRISKRDGMSEMP